VHGNVSSCSSVPDSGWTMGSELSQAADIEDRMFRFTSALIEWRGNDRPADGWGRLDRQLEEMFVALSALRGTLYAIRENDDDTCTCRERQR
jgi:hypothetical protein